MMRTAVPAAAILLALPGARGHGAIVFPKSRNAADGALSPWKDWYWKPGMTEKGTDANVGSFSESGNNTEASCSIPAKDGVKGSTNASNGQACFCESRRLRSPLRYRLQSRVFPYAPLLITGFSNGCTIGCDSCDGTNNHPGHGQQEFLYKGKNVVELTKANITVPAWGLMKGDMVLDPKSFQHPAPNQSTGKKTPHAHSGHHSLLKKRASQPIWFAWSKSPVPP